MGKKPSVVSVAVRAVRDLRRADVSDAQSRATRAKVFYAAVTYIVCSVLYTGINTPVTSILSALTPNPQERVTLTCFRMFGSKLGVLMVNLTALQAGEIFGPRRRPQRFHARDADLCDRIHSSFSARVSEISRKSSTRKSNPQPILDSFRAIKGNWPWIIIFTSSLFFWIAFIARVSVAPYFFEYVLHRKDLIPAGVQPGFHFARARRLACRCFADGLPSATSG